MSNLVLYFLIAMGFMAVWGCLAALNEIIEILRDIKWEIMRNN